MHIACPSNNSLRYDGVNTLVVKKTNTQKIEFLQKYSTIDAIITLKHYTEASNLPTSVFG